MDGVFEPFSFFGTLPSLRDNDWTRILGWPGYQVCGWRIDDKLCMDAPPDDTRKRAPIGDRMHEEDEERRR